MPAYSYVHSGRLFDLVLPKPVVDICAKTSPGETSQFHFVDHIDSAYDPTSGEQPSKSKHVLTVSNLEDGSWSITNNKDDANNTQMRAKYLYIIVTEGDDTETKEELSPEDTAPAEELSADDTVPEEEVGPEDTVSQDPALEDSIPEPATAETLEPEGVVMETDDGSATVVVEEPAVLESGTEEHEVAVYLEPDNEDAPEEPSEEVLEETVSGADHDYMGPTGPDGTVVLVSTVSEDEQPAILHVSEAAEPSGAESGVRHVQCSLCPGVSKDYWNYMKHLKRYHTSDQNYWTIVQHIKPLLKSPCQDCGKVFSSPKVLLEHEQKVHSKSVGIVCNYCGKFFKSTHHLKTHIRYLHLRQHGTFLCDHCPAKFNTSNVLREHIKYSHSTKDRTNQCTECDFTYAFPKQFYEHFSRVHAPKKHTCPHCEYKCATKWYMKKHVQNCAPKTSHMSEEAAPAAKRARVRRAEVRGLSEVSASREDQMTYEVVDGQDTTMYCEVSEEATTETPPTSSLATTVTEGKTRVALLQADGTEQTIEVVIPQNS